MRFPVLLLFILLSLGGFSQQGKLSLLVGYAVVKSDSEKRVVLNRGFNLGMEWNMGKQWFLVAGAGNASFRFNSVDTVGTSLFNTHNFIALSISVKKYYPVSRKSYTFLDIGPVLNYHLFHKREWKENAEERSDKKTNPGSNLGLFGTAGFKTLLIPGWYFEVGIMSSEDLWGFYKNKRDRVKANRESLVFSLYKNL